MGSLLKDYYGLHIRIFDHGPDFASFVAQESGWSFEVLVAPWRVDWSISQKSRSLDMKTWSPIPLTSELQWDNAAVLIVQKPWLVAFVPTSYAVCIGHRNRCFQFEARFKHVDHAQEFEEGARKDSTLTCLGVLHASSVSASAIAACPRSFQAPATRDQRPSWLIKRAIAERA